MAERDHYGRLRSFEAKEIRSLTWRGDELVDWVGGGTRLSLEGERRRAFVFYAYRFDTAIATPDGEWAILYERHGTKALLVREGAFVRELNRSYYFASSYDFPICLWRDADGRALVGHCPEEYNRIEIEDAQTGARLTAGEREPADFFHSRLQVSPDGKRMLTAGWVWHPFDAVGAFDLEEALRDPTHLDSPEEVTPPSARVGLAEESSACWASATTVLVGGTAKREDRETAAEPPEPGLHRQGLAQVDLSTRAVVAFVRLPFPTGAMMAVGSDRALCLFEHPRLVSLETGEVLAAWPELSTGAQTSSISSHLPPPPPMALDRIGRRLAVADGERVHVLSLGECAD